MAANQPTSSTVFLVKVGTDDIFSDTLSPDSVQGGVLSSRVLHNGYGAARRMNTPLARVDLFFPPDGIEVYRYKGPSNFSPLLCLAVDSIIIFNVCLELLRTLRNNRSSGHGLALLGPFPAIPSSFNGLLGTA